MQCHCFWHKPFPFVFCKNIGHGTVLIYYYDVR